jgi:bifunctional non-homologous end joining protein LigD
VTVRASEVAKLIPAGMKRLAPRAPQPEWIDPMLATLTDTPFSDPEWIFEPKLDGVRCLAFKSGRKVRLMSRNRLSLAERYPDVAVAVSELDVTNVILDGEVAVVSEGVARFQSLQRHLLEGGGLLVFFVFDVPHMAGYDLRALPLLARKEVLSLLTPPSATIELVSHRVETGESYLVEACDKGWEGLIAKRAVSKYLSGRSKEWLKFKCSQEQEFVVGGWTEPRGARIGFGALLVGYFEDGRFKYAGKVGTGYNTRLLLELHKKLRSLEQKDSPFDGKPPARKEVHWTKPQLVVQIGFSEWTRDGRLRHPRFLGERDDKSPRDVTRERPR